MNEPARTLPSYPANTILVVEVGSTAHGTGLPGGEDHDEIALWIESATQVFALRDGEPRARSERTRAEGERSGPGDTDRMLYTLRHFLTLAASGNPSILLVLWAPIIRTSAAGDALRELAPAFIGRHLIPRYRGYMQAQTDRLLGLRGGRHRIFREDTTGVGYDTKYAMHAARLGYQGIELLTAGGLTLPIAGETGEWLRSVRRGEVARDAWEARVRELDQRLADLAADETLPKGPRREAIIAWSVRAHSEAWAASAR